MVRVILIAVLAATLAGCGGSSSSSGEGSKSAAQIVSDAATALGKVKSFHVDGTEDAKVGRMTISGDVALPGRIHLVVTLGPARVEVLTVAGAIYLRGDALFWRGVAGRLSALLADKWVKAPPSAASSFGSILVLADPSKVGRCLVESHLGALEKAGTATEAGKPVVVVKNKGDAPGSAPGRLYVAARGEPLPLRATQTGPQKPGGKPDTTCNETQNDVTGSGTASDIRLSGYDRAVSIAAPPKALDLGKLAGSGA
jgi:hypothetical protein